MSNDTNLTNLIETRDSTSFYVTIEREIFSNVLNTKLYTFTNPKI